MIERFDSRQLFEDPTTQWWYPKWKGKAIYNGNPEALGWVLTSIADAVAAVSFAAFFSIAILNLAKESVGCETIPPPGEINMPDCEHELFGMKPSSILTSYQTFVGMTSCFVLPLVGALIDFTAHRLTLGRLLALAICKLLFMMIFISEESWYFIAILQILFTFCIWLLNVVQHAYLPELADSEDVLNEYTTSFSVASVAAMLLFLVTIMGIAKAADKDDDDVFIAILSQCFTFVICATSLITAWLILFKERPALHELPPSRSLFTAAFIQPIQTTVRIFRELPALKWFLISFCLTDAALHSFGSIVVTFFSTTLAFSPIENAIAVTFMLTGSIPGALFGSYLGQRLDPRKSNILGTILLTIGTLFAAIFINEPGQQTRTYVFGMIWGLGSGWKWTMDRLVIASIIPKGQDAELMGIFLFAGKLLTWLPPLVVTVMNEKGLDRRLSTGTLSFWYFLGVIALFLMGNFRDAVEAAGRSYLLESWDKRKIEKKDDASKASYNIRAMMNWDESTVASSDAHSVVDKEIADIFFGEKAPEANAPSFSEGKGKTDTSKSNEPESSTSADNKTSLPAQDTDIGLKVQERGQKTGEHDDDDNDRSEGYFSFPTPKGED